MDASFFSECPSDLLRLKISRVLFQIRGGIHKSKIKGEGPEFKGFRPWDSADNPARINYPASFKLSPNLDELVVRTSYGEKKISIVTILDARITMGVPQTKFEHAGELFWLFALSAFKELDRFRTIVIFENALADSGWIFSEANLAEFLIQEVINRDPNLSLPEKEKNPIALLADVRLCDALLVVISDFCNPWEEEIDALEWLGMQARNIQGMFLAIDEWSDVKFSGYGTDVIDPRTGVVRRMSYFDLKEVASASQERFISIGDKLLLHPVSFFSIPLIQDPIAAFLRASIGSEIE